MKRKTKWTVIIVCWMLTVAAVAVLIGLAATQPDVTMSYPEYLFWTFLGMLTLVRAAVFVFKLGKAFFQAVQEIREERQR